MNTPDMIKKAKEILGAAFMDDADTEVSVHVELANAYSAIAQAEALQRIANALEKVITTDMETFRPALRVSAFE